MAAEAGRNSTTSVASVAPVVLAAGAGRNSAPVEFEAAAGRKPNLPAAAEGTTGKEGMGSHWHLLPPWSPLLQLWLARLLVG